MASLIKNDKIVPLPKETMMGAMAHYISTPNKSFVPMNANLGLFPELGYKHKKKERKMLYRDRSLEALKTFKEENAWII
jgi:methylenetetrahydrofolate--tRNA-(uracil-5-)-methyltransferase